MVYATVYQAGRAVSFMFVFFNDTATTEIYTLSLHDALPICASGGRPSCLSRRSDAAVCDFRRRRFRRCFRATRARSEEHTSELQSQSNLVCRLLLEKKKDGRPVRMSGGQSPG